MLIKNKKTPDRIYKFNKTISEEAFADDIVNLKVWNEVLKKYWTTLIETRL